MSYEEFKNQYNNLLTKLLSYRIDTVGSKTYVSLLADLTEAHPDYKLRLDNENDKP